MLVIGTKETRENTKIGSEELEYGMRLKRKKQTKKPGNMVIGRRKVI